MANRRVVSRTTIFFRGLVALFAVIATVSAGFLYAVSTTMVYRQGDPSFNGSHYWNIELSLGAIFLSSAGLALLSWSQTRAVKRQRNNRASVRACGGEGGWISDLLLNIAAVFALFGLALLLANYDTINWLHVLWGVGSFALTFVIIGVGAFALNAVLPKRRTR